MNYQMQLGAQNPMMPQAQSPVQNMQPQGTSMQNPPMPPQAMAEGGHAGEGGHGGMEMVHIAKRELPHLAAAQGGATMLPGTNVHHFGKLESMLSSDSGFKKHMGDHVAHFMKGGDIHTIRDMANRMKSQGRHGDNTVAFIGPHTRALFKHLAGGESINPVTGAPEYFSFGNLFSTLGNYASKAAGHVGNFVKSAANTVAKHAPGIINKAQDFIQSPHGQNLLGAGLTAGMNALGGQNAKDSIMSGVNNFAGNYDNAAGRGAAAATSPEEGNFAERARRGVNAAAAPVDTKLGRFAEGVSQPGYATAQQRIGRGISRAAEGSSNPALMAARTAGQNIAAGRGARRVARETARTAGTAMNPALLNQAYGANSFDPSLFQ